jgi:hypothetical protein
VVSRLAFWRDPSDYACLMPAMPNPDAADLGNRDARSP